jgi:ABC-type xylose transport system permease subunit
MKAVTAIVTTIGVLAFSGAAFAQCSGKSHTPMPDQTAETPIVILPDSIGS